MINERLIIWKKKITNSHVFLHSSINTGLGYSNYAISFWVPSFWMPGFCTKLRRVFLRIDEKWYHLNSLEQRQDWLWSISEGRESHRGEQVHVSAPREAADAAESQAQTNIPTKGSSWGGQIPRDWGMEVSAPTSPWADNANVFSCQEEKPKSHL